MIWRGIAFPVQAGEHGLFKSEQDIKLIEGNIIQILSTKKGERVMLPEFGSKVPDFIHEPLDHITCALIRFELIRAIERWEPRVVLDNNNTEVIAYPSEAKVLARLRYFFRPRGQEYTLALEINQNGGVQRWLD